MGTVFRASFDVLYSASNRPQLFAVASAMMLSTFGSICRGQDKITPHLPKSDRLDSIGDPLPENAVERFGTLRFQHPSSVIDLALSPDGKTLVSIGSQELVAWETQSGKQLWLKHPKQLGINLPGASYGVRSVIFSADSSCFYAVQSFNTVLKFDVATGQSQEILLQRGPKTGFARSLDVTQDGKRFAVGGPAGVSVYSLDAGLLFHVPNDNSGELIGIERDRLVFGGHYSLAVFSHEEDRIAIVSSDSPKTIRLFNAFSGEEELSIQLSSWLVRMDFSPDNRHLAATERDSSVRVYETKSGELVWEHSAEIMNNAESYTSGITHSPDGRLLAVGAPIGSDYWIHMFDAHNGESLRYLIGHAWKPWALAFDADSRTLYSAGWDGPIRRWDTITGEQLPLPIGMRASSVVAASPIEESVAFADDLGGVHVVAGAGREQVNLWQRKLTFDKLAFSPDGRFVAMGGSEQAKLHVEVVDLHSNATLHEWIWDKGRDPHSSIESLEFSPDGSRLAAAVFRQDQVLLWNLADGKEIARLPHNNVYGLSFDADGMRLVTAGWDRIVRQWYARDGKLVSMHDMRQISDEQGDLRMYTVCCSPAGDMLATAHLDGRVRLWNQSDFSFRGGFKVDGRFIYGSIAFSLDGVWLATGQMNGAVEIFDPYTASRAYEVGRHEHYAYTVKFGHNNSKLVSGGSDEVSYRWDLVPDLPKSSDMDTRVDSKSTSDFPRLWKELGGDDAAQAYRAYWGLIQRGNDIVEPLGEILRSIETLVDMSGLSADASGRKKKLAHMLIAKDDSAEPVIRALRGVSVLGHIGSESSLAALEELSQSQAHLRIAQAAERWLNEESE